MTSPDPTALGQIHGIVDYWARRTRRASHPVAGDLAARDLADRILLDVLGLGLTQASTHLGTVQPDFPAFEAWVLDTAGPQGDRLKVFRRSA